ADEAPPLPPVEVAVRPEGPPAAPAPPALALNYIPAKASAAVVIRPARILKSPLVSEKVTQAATQPMLKEFGFPPNQVKQMIVVSQIGTARVAARPRPKNAGAELDLTATPLPGAIIQFTGPGNGKDVLGILLKGLREENHNGHVYYRSSTGESMLGMPLAG